MAKTYTGSGRYSATTERDDAQHLPCAPAHIDTQFEPILCFPCTTTLHGNPLCAPLRPRPCGLLVVRSIGWPNPHDRPTDLARDMAKKIRRS